MSVSLPALVLGIFLSMAGQKWNQASKIAVNFDCAVMAAFVSYKASSGTFNPTEGRIYVDGYYDDVDCFRDFAPWDLNIIFGTCGVKEDVNFTVIFLHDKDYFLGTIDEAQVFNCKSHAFQTSLRNVTAYVPAGEIIPIIGQVATVPGYNVTVTMVLKRTNGDSVIGVNSQPVTLGQNVTMELNVTKNDRIKIKASHCWAAGIIKNNTWKHLDLVTGGCPAVQFFSGFTQDPVDNHLTATFPMFLITPRHDTNRSTGFFCTVTACSVNNEDPECTPSACPGDDPGWGRRRKRWARDIDDLLGSFSHVALGYFVDVIVESDAAKMPFNLSFANITTSSPKDKTCFSPIVFTVVLSMMILVLVVMCALSSGCVVYVKQDRNHRREIRAQQRRGPTKTELRNKPEPGSPGTFIRCRQNSLTQVTYCTSTLESRPGEAEL